MGGKRYQVLLGLLLVLTAFFAFGRDNENPTGAAVQKVQPYKGQVKTTPIILNTKRIDIGKLPPGTIIIQGNNKQGLQRAQKDIVFLRLNSLLRSPGKVSQNE